MGTVYLRGSIWWLGFVGTDGRWHYKSAKTDDERQARATLAAIEEELRKGNRLAALGPLSVAEWGEKWQALRLARVPPVWNAAKEWRAVKRYAMPLVVDEKRFGKHLLADVRPRHALALIRGLRASINRKGKPLAPRTVANIWGTVHKLFEDAVLELDGALAGNPMVLPDVERPQRVDLNPAWRKTAVYSRVEAERLISAAELGPDRRVLYAMALLGGLRAGEVLDRTWADYDADAEPLGRLSVHSSYSRANKTSKGTKTEQPREVPVHPRLAALLAEWKLGGWEKAYGRAPRPDDFIVLNTRGNQGDDQYVLDGLKRDLKALGIRHRRFHDMRRTFISLALTDGASRDVLKRVTHGAKGDILDQYTSFDWPTLCAAVSKLKLGVKQRAVKAVGRG
jgi:integrase